MPTIRRRLSLGVAFAKPQAAFLFSRSKASFFT
jgi:hypothetical protein